MEERVTKLEDMLKEVISTIEGIEDFIGKSDCTVDGSESSEEEN